MSIGDETSLIQFWGARDSSTPLRFRSTALGMTEKDHRVAPDRAITTLSHRSHKSGCALLAQTVGRWRQQRAHFLYGVFVTETLASFAWRIVRLLTMKNSSSSSWSIFSVTSESEFNTTRASSVLPISFSWRARSIACPITLRNLNSSANLA